MSRLRLRSIFVSALFVLIIPISLGVSGAAATAEPGLSPLQAQDLVQRYLAERAFRVTAAASAQAGQSLTAVPMTGAMRDRLGTEARKLDEARVLLQNSPSKGFAKAKVDVTVNALTATGTGVDVHATELTSLYYGHGDATAPPSEDYLLEHDFTFVDQNGVWTLAAATPRLGGDGPPMATQYGVMVPRKGSGQKAPSGRLVALPQASVTTAGQTTAGVISQTQKAPTDVAPQYDYGAMVNYANTYWSSYNSAYRSFGNDCTNFISQIMRAGGWQDAPGWYQDDHYWWYNAANQTYSWAGSPNWGAFAQVYSHRTTPLGNVNQLLPSDVLQVDWTSDGTIDHTMIVTATGSGEIYLTYHTNNRHNVAFYGWLLPQEPSATWYAHRT